MWEARFESCNFEHARQTTEQSGSAAGLQDKLVWPNEHAGFGEQVGVDMVGFEDRQDFAVDEIKHALPRLGGYHLQTTRLA